MKDFRTPRAGQFRPLWKLFARQLRFLQFRYEIANQTRSQFARRFLLAELGTFDNSTSWNLFLCDLFWRMFFVSAVF